jgi:hypothetical protein
MTPEEIAEIVENSIVESQEKNSQYVQIPLILNAYQLSNVLNKGNKII